MAHTATTTVLPIVMDTVYVINDCMGDETRLYDMNAVFPTMVTRYMKSGDRQHTTVIDNDGKSEHDMCYPAHN